MPILAWLYPCDNCGLRSKLLWLCSHTIVLEISCSCHHDHRMMFSDHAHSFIFIKWRQCLCLSKPINLTMLVCLLSPKVSHQDLWHWPRSTPRADVKGSHQGQLTRSTYKVNLHGQLVWSTHKDNSQGHSIRLVTINIHQCYTLRSPNKTIQHDHLTRPSNKIANQDLPPRSPKMATNKNQPQR